MKIKLFGLVLAGAMLFASGCSCAPTDGPYYDENPEDFDPKVFAERHKDVDAKISNIEKKKSKLDSLAYLETSNTPGRITSANGEISVRSGGGETIRVFSYAEVIATCGTTAAFEEAVKSRISSKGEIVFSYDVAKDEASVKTQDSKFDIFVGIDQEVNQHYFALNDEIAYYLTNKNGVITMDDVSSYNVSTLMGPFLEFCVTYGMLNKDTLTFSYTHAQGEEYRVLNNDNVETASLRLRKESNGEYVPDYFAYKGFPTKMEPEEEETTDLSVTEFRYKDIVIDKSALKPLECDHEHKGYNYDPIDATHHRKFCSSCGKYIAEPVAHVHHEGIHFCEKCLYNGDLIELDNPNLKKVFGKDSSYYKYLFQSDSNGRIFVNNSISLYDKFTGAYTKSSAYNQKEFTLLDGERTVWTNANFVDIYYPEAKELYVLAQNNDSTQLNDCCLAEAKWYFAKFYDVELTPDEGESVSYDTALTTTISKSLPELLDMYSFESGLLLERVSVNHEHTTVFKTDEGCLHIEETICDKCEEVVRASAEYHHDFEYEVVARNALPNWVKPQFEEGNSIFLTRECKACDFDDPAIYEVKSGVSYHSPTSAYSLIIYQHLEGKEPKRVYEAIPHILDENDICLICGEHFLDVGDYEISFGGDAGTISASLANVAIGDSTYLYLGITMIYMPDDKYLYPYSSYVTVQEDESHRRYAEVIYNNNLDGETETVTIKVTADPDNHRIIYDIYLKKGEGEKVLKDTTYSYYQVAE